VLQQKELMQRSESYQFCCLPVSHTSVDASPCTICCSALDGPAVDGPAVDGPAVDGPAVDGPAVDGPAVDGPAEERVCLQLAYMSMHRSIYIRYKVQVASLALCASSTVPSFCGALA